ncbi:hypothetical protein RRG08_059536 [Elysia crispata]|uniref:Uncharacterized protein n=1 Tax=Elysia crispata TaxID=231223 RepID=A0AAE1DI90_9GAST|nr:hypothetical protein RRG08_059536 [Elysia crispata]
MAKVIHLTRIKRTVTRPWKGPSSHRDHLTNDPPRNGPSFLLHDPPWNGSSRSCDPSYRTVLHSIGIVFRDGSIMERIT